MNKEHTNTHFLFERIHLWLIIAGLVLIIIAQLFQYSLLKIDIDILVSNLGALLLVTGGLQWLFDSYVKNELFEEISSKTIQNVNISKSGIADIKISSRDVDYTNLILRSNEITIGINYSPRLLEDYIEEFRERAKSNLKTTIILLDLSSKAAYYLRTIKDENSHLEPNNKKIHGIVDELNKINNTISIFHHESILRYSFFKSDNSIWIKPYRSSPGRCKTPAVKLDVNTSLYNYYNNDIDNLKKK